MTLNKRLHKLENAFEADAPRCQACADKPDPSVVYVGSSDDPTPDCGCAVCGWAPARIIRAVWDREAALADG